MRLFTGDICYNVVSRRGWCNYRRTRHVRFLPHLSRMPTRKFRDDESGKQNASMNRSSCSIHYLVVLTPLP